MGRRLQKGFEVSIDPPLRVGYEVRASQLAFGNTTNGQRCQKSCFIFCEQTKLSSEKSDQRYCYRLSGIYSEGGRQKVLSIYDVAVQIKI